MGRGRKQKPKPTTNAATLRSAIDDILQEVITEISHDIGIEVGRHLRSGQLEALGLLDNEVDPSLQIHDAVDPNDPSQKIDVFGNKVDKSSLPASCEYCECTNCGKKLASNRYTAHLAKCVLGHGRATAGSSRTAAGAGLKKVEDVDRCDASAASPSKVASGSSSGSSKRFYSPGKADAKSASRSFVKTNKPDLEAQSIGVISLKNIGVAKKKTRTRLELKSSSSDAASDFGPPKVDSKRKLSS